VEGGPDFEGRVAAVGELKKTAFVGSADSKLGKVCARTTQITGKDEFLMAT
jgi:hypothetical protein